MGKGREGVRTEVCRNLLTGWRRWVGQQNGGGRGPATAWGGLRTEQGAQLGALAVAEEEGLALVPSRDVLRAPSRLLGGGGTREAQGDQGRARARWCGEAGALGGRRASVAEPTAGRAREAAGQARGHSSAHERVLKGPLGSLGSTEGGSEGCPACRPPPVYPLHSQARCPYGSGKDSLPGSELPCPLGASGHSPNGSTWMLSPGGDYRHPHLPRGETEGGTG